MKKFSLMPILIEFFSQFSLKNFISVMPPWTGKGPRPWPLVAPIASQSSGPAEAEQGPHTAWCTALRGPAGPGSDSDRGGSATVTGARWAAVPPGAGCELVSVEKYLEATDEIPTGAR